MVGAGIAIFIQSDLVHQLRYMLHNRCSNNQAEQLATAKPLETIEKSHINFNIQRTITIHTDSRITFNYSRKRNHNYLIEEIRKKAIALEKCNWTVIFNWIKAHEGIYGNELANKLAKETARNKDTAFISIPKSEIVQQARDQSIAK